MIGRRGGHTNGALVSRLTLFDLSILTLPLCILHLQSNCPETRQKKLKTWYILSWVVDKRTDAKFLSSVSPGGRPSLFREQEFTYFTIVSLLSSRSILWLTDSLDEVYLVADKTVSVYCSIPKNKFFFGELTVSCRWPFGRSRPFRQWIDWRCKDVLLNLNISLFIYIILFFFVWSRILFFHSDMFQTISVFQKYNFIAFSHVEVNPELHIINCSSPFKSFLWVQGRDLIVVKELVDIINPHRIWWTGRSYLCVWNIFVCDLLALNFPKRLEVSKCSHISVQFPISERQLKLLEFDKHLRSPKKTKNPTKSLI